jgi:hypothetical protein
MATYSLGFHGFSTLTVSNVAGQAGVQLTTNTTQGIGTPGERFALAGGTATLTTVVVEDDDPLATDGSVNETGQRARIAGSSGFGTPGQPVDLEYRITALADGIPPREVTFHVLSIGGRNVGLVGTEPLQPGVSYTVIRATDQETPATLRRYGLSGRITPDVPGQNALPWDAVFCFTFGTLVDTPDGLRLIEDLCPGDLVTTLGNGSQPLRWAGNRRVSAPEMQRLPDLAPVEFATGAIGNSRPLLVSPQHRILLNDWRAQVYFGEDEVLIPAKAMVNGTTIRQVTPPDGVTYVHLLFDRHEILISEGALSESFHPGEAGLHALDAVQRRELELLFPGLELERRRAAFPIVKLAEARALRLPD